ncbi:NUDIX domain-containing protein [Aerophototrophica crusticola]|uniref:NUDIX domain-containing protein n=1 Tax=Aerophototrophica crusticola TaxID=1709002 RepID=A0A858R4S7_9PROT|nr:NUDIX domain-containing protein [Rhodospirillaceae bacterium B3]
MATPPDPQPRVGVGAFILHHGKLLLVLRKRDPEAGHWGLPGGKVDFLEPLETAIVREVAEELGVTIRLDGLLCVLDQIDPQARTHWVAPTYRAHITAGEPTVQEPDALGGCGWFELDALPQPLTLATHTALAHLLTRGG